MYFSHRMYLSQNYSNIFTSLNKKYPTIKFELWFLHSSFEFQNTLGQNCTTLYKKATGRRDFLHYQSAHPERLKDGIFYIVTQFDYSNAPKKQLFGLTCVNLNTYSILSIFDNFSLMLNTYKFETQQDLNKTQPLSARLCQNTWLATNLQKSQ